MKPAPRVRGDVSSHIGSSAPPALGGSSRRYGALPLPVTGRSGQGMRVPCSEGRGGPERAASLVRGGVFPVSARGGLGPWGVPQTSHGEPQARPSAPLEPGGRPPPQKGRRCGGGAAAGPAPASPHWRAGAARTTEQYGCRAPHDPPVTTAYSGRAEGGFRSARAPGGAVHGPPHTPPHPWGGSLAPTARARRKGARRRHGGARIEYRRPPPRRGAGRPRRDNPPPPAPPPARKPRGPQPPPPEAGGMAPPRPRGEPERNPPPRPDRGLPWGPRNIRARAYAPGRRTDRTQRSLVSTNWSGMGGHTPHGQQNASDTRFVACPGKAEGRNEAERPPALQAPPRPHNRGVRRTPPPPGPPPST